MSGLVIRRHVIMDVNTETVAVCMKRIFIHFILSWIHFKTIKNTDGDNFVFLKSPLPCVYTWCAYEYYVRLCLCQDIGVEIRGQLHLLFVFHICIFQVRSPTDLGEVLVSSPLF